MNNEQTINDLKANPRNPRTISNHDAKSLAKGMEEFGDLAPIVFNQRTNQLVGGHQRISVLKQMLAGDKQIVITQQLDAPDEVGTIALGYVIYKERQFAYRVVDWPLDRELTANILANRAQGQFDTELLAEVTYMIQQENAELLGLTGQTQDEIEKLLKSVGVGDVGEPAIDEPIESKLIFKVTDEQRTLIERAISKAQSDQKLGGSDPEVINGKALVIFVEAYLAVNPLPTYDTFTPPELPES